MVEIKENILHSTEAWEWGLDTSVRYVTRLMSLISAELAEAGDRDWLVDCVEDKRISLGQVEARARRVASGLKRLGLAPGHILHTAYGSNIEFYWPVFGAWLCGAAASVADPGLSVEVIRAQLEDTKARIVVVASKALPAYLEANTRLAEEDRVQHILVLDAEPGQKLPPGVSSFRALYQDDGSQCPETLPDVGPEETMVVLWTSGTTGRPKGVLHTQRFMLAMIRKSKKTLPPRKMSLQSNTMFHLGGFLNPMDGLVKRFTVLFVKDTEFTGERMLEAVNTYRPDNVMAIPSHFQAVSCVDFTGYDLKSVTIIIPSGGMLTESLAKKFYGVFPNLRLVLQIYGSTEANLIAAAVDTVSSYLGRLTTGNSAYIRDVDTGARLGPGEVGEICVKTMICMKSYLNNPEATAEYFTEDGYAAMGDLGYYDQEGRMFYKDRIKDVMRVKAKWFGPSELEEHVEKLDEVYEVCVWSSYDTELCDDLIHAAVVMRPGARVTKETIMAHVRDNLPSHMNINGDIFFMASIPHNPQGKKLRRILKQQHSDMKLHL